MAAFALFDALPDFGDRPAPAAAMPARRIEQAPVSPPVLDTAEIVRAEVARAEAALEARLALAHEAELEAMRKEHAATVETLMHRFGEDAASAISARMGEMERTLADETQQTVARILGSVLSDELARRSVQSLAVTIRAALGDGETGRLRVHAPQSLLEALRIALGGRAGRVDYAESAGFDLTLSIDGSLYETRLAEWSTTLAEILS